MGADTVHYSPQTGSLAKRKDCPRDRRKGFPPYCCRGLCTDSRKTDRFSPPCVRGYRKVPAEHYNLRSRRKSLRDISKMEGPLPDTAALLPQTTLYTGKYPIVSCSKYCSFRCHCSELPSAFFSDSIKSFILFIRAKTSA